MKVAVGGQLGGNGQIRELRTLTTSAGAGHGEARGAQWPGVGSSRWIRVGRCLSQPLTVTTQTRPLAFSAVLFLSVNWGI